VDARGVLRLLVPGVAALTRYEGTMRPTAFAPKELNAAEEARIGALVNRANHVVHPSTSRFHPFPVKPK
jgi:hypothetical protein